MLLRSPDGFYVPCDMRSRTVFTIEDDEVLNQVVEKVLERGVRVITRPPTGTGDRFSIHLPGADDESG